MKDNKAKEKIAYLEEKNKKQIDWLEEKAKWLSNLVTQGNMYAWLLHAPNLREEYTRYGYTLFERDLPIDCYRTECEKVYASLIYSALMIFKGDECAVDKFKGNLYKVNMIARKYKNTKENENE